MKAGGENMTVKLIALDLDGTTLNSKNQLTEYTQETLESAVKQGIRVVIATGRPLVALPEVVTSVSGIEYAITSNGAAIVDLNTKDILHKNNIEEKAMEHIYKMLKQHDFMTEIFIHGKAYVEKNIFDNLDTMGFTETHKAYVRRTRLPHENVLEFMLENSGEVENINVVFSNQSDKAYMYERLKELEHVTVTSSFSHNLEINGSTTTKASALLQMCKMFDIKPEEILACGDSPNDEEMLKLAGFSVAMGNAEESVKQVAKYVTSTNDEDGVAHAIRKYAFGE